MDAARIEGESKLKDLNDAHKKSTEEMKAKHKQEIDELKQAMKALESQVCCITITVCYLLFPWFCLINISDQPIPIPINTSD